MKRIIAGIFVGILLWTFGCTIDQGEGVFNVKAEITNIGHTILSVKYYIGETVVFDDIPMQKNTGILQMIKDSGEKVIPLKISIEFLKSNDDNSNSSSFKYYYGANFLSESQSHDLDAIILIAKENKDIFSWKMRDGSTTNDSKKEPTKIESSEKIIEQLPMRKETSKKL
jgi:hypothetical protein